LDGYERCHRINIEIFASCSDLKLAHELGQQLKLDEVNSKNHSVLISVFLG